MSATIRISPYCSCQPKTRFEYAEGSKVPILRDGYSVSYLRGRQMLSIRSAKLSTNYSEEEKGTIQRLDSSPPVSIELEKIDGESQFDRVIDEAQRLDEPVVIVWMANWCRKCIYLKPKLEKLAADYYQRIRFYCLDVNNIPHRLVVRAGVIKMPTIQLWMNRDKLGEVIGGHKPHLVINEVRDMIDNNYEFQ